MHCTEQTKLLQHGLTLCCGIDQPAITKLHLKRPGSVLSPEIEKLLAVHRKDLIAATDFVTCPIAVLLHSHSQRLEFVQLDLNWMESPAEIELTCQALRSLLRLKTLWLNAAKSIPIDLFEALTTRIPIVLRSLHIDCSTTIGDGSAIAIAIGKLSTLKELELHGRFQCHEAVLTNTLWCLWRLAHFSISANGKLEVFTAHSSALFQRIRFLSVHRGVSSADDLVPICEAVGTAPKLRVCQLDGLNKAGIEALAKSLRSAHQIEQLDCTIKYGQSCSTSPVLLAIRDHPNNISQLSTDIADSATFRDLISLIESHPLYELQLFFTDDEPPTDEELLAALIRSNGSIYVTYEDSSDAVSNASSENYVRLFVVLS